LLRGFPDISSQFVPKMEQEQVSDESAKTKKARKSFAMK
jgi:hypothetical protein